jgi:predicted PurR-regulated permease PerM
MLGMMLLRIPYAPMVGALVGITALIPVVGGFIGAGVGAFMILTVSPVKALVFVIYLIILQQIEGNVIYPKVMGSKVNLPAIWILVAVTVGGAVGGVVGMFLSVPITSTAYLLLKEATKTKEQKNRNSSSGNTLKINHRPKINRKRNNIKRFRKNTNNNQKK